MKDIQITMEPDGWMEKTGGYAKDMTLRDYLAAKAMQAAITRNGFYDDEPQLSRWCYETADAMLKAREA